LLEWAQEHKQQQEWISSPSYQAEVPKCLAPVPRLETDLKALAELTAPLSPPLHIVRTKLILLAFYSGGDASGSGFGGAISTWQGVLIRHGIWTYDVATASSNFRELRNLVEHVEIATADGALQGVELFLFTDNQVAKSAYFNG